jgi:hypothetical protein
MTKKKLDNANGKRIITTEFWKMNMENRTIRMGKGKVKVENRAIRVRKG